MGRVPFCSHMVASELETQGVMGKGWGVNGLELQAWTLPLCIYLENEEGFTVPSHIELEVIEEEVLTFLVVTRLYGNWVCVYFGLVSRKETVAISYLI